MGEQPTVRPSNNYDESNVLKRKRYIKKEVKVALLIAIVFVLLWLNTTVSHVLFNHDDYIYSLENSRHMPTFEDTEVFGIMRCGDVILLPHRDKETDEIRCFFFGGRASFPPYINLNRDYIDNHSDQSHAPTIQLPYQTSGMMIATTGFPTKNNPMRWLLERPANQALLLSYSHNYGEAYSPLAQQPQEISFSVLFEEEVIYYRRMIIPYGEFFIDLISVPEGAVLSATTPTKSLTFEIPALSKGMGYPSASEQPWVHVTKDHWETVEEE